jgi:hypothetical protein
MRGRFESLNGHLPGIACTSAAGYRMKCVPVAQSVQFLS